MDILCFNKTPNEDHVMNLGKSIRIGCAIKEINKKELAQITGMAESTISLLANNHRFCSKSTLESLAKAFNMPVSEFIALGEQ